MTQATVPLTTSKQQHPTRLIRHEPSPQPSDANLPADVERITYTSQGRQLKAVVAVPHTPGLHPAVLYCHGGFAFGADDFEDARPFLNAGYVVMCPMWRGENGNPGDFELYFGEVDDARAALDALAQRSDVDKTHLYAAGHSAGGVIAMLLAESDNRLRAVGACGAFADLREASSRGVDPPTEPMPFNWKDAEETELRSFGTLTCDDLNCPALLCYGSRETYLLSQAGQIPGIAEQLHKSISLQTVPDADHFTALAPAVQQMIAFFSRP